MNQSDAILANLRHSMDLLMEPTIQSQNITDNRTRSTRGSNFHVHTRQCLTRCPNSNQRNSNAPPRCFSGRYLRHRSNRASRYINMNTFDPFRSFGDHSYPREPDPDPENNESNEIDNIVTNTQSNTEPNEDPNNSMTQEELVNELLRISPLPRENATENDQTEPVRSSTPVPFPADHNYPLSDSPQENPVDTIEINMNPIADHTYPRDPQSTSRSTPDYISPLVSSLHSTISHISMQTNLLRRQVETIEIIDRARYEVNQLQEMRRMWEDIRREVIFFNALNDRRANNSNMSNVRQMMAWTRISDPSPSSESAQSSTEQSTPEPCPSTDIPSTSRSSASSSNESRSNQNPQPYSVRFRQNHIKKRAQSRIYWRRRTMRNESPNIAVRRFNRSFNQYRDMSRSRPTQDIRDTNFCDVNVSLMIRGLENLLMQNSRLVGRVTISPERNNIERRILSERTILNRLRNARQRLSNFNDSTDFDRLEPVEYATTNRNDSIRYDARLKLSIYLETFARFLENRSAPLPTNLSEQINILTELTILATDLLLLQIMENIPSSSGSFLDPERETLARRIDQLCSVLMQNPSRTVSANLSRVLHSLRLTVRFIISSVRLSHNEIIIRRSHNVNRREAMLDLNRQLRDLYQVYISPEANNTTEPGPSTSQPAQSSPTSSNQGLSQVYRLGDLLARLRSVRGRLEQMSQNSLGRLEQMSQSRNAVQTTNNSSTEHDPARSTDESPSDRESESYEGV